MCGCMWDVDGALVESITFNRRVVGSTPTLAATRGVQYVHWVMHKCIMVKAGGKNYT